MFWQILIFYCYALFPGNWANLGKSWFYTVKTICAWFCGGKGVGKGEGGEGGESREGGRGKGEGGSGLNFQANKVIK